MASRAARCSATAQLAERRSPHRPARSRRATRTRASRPAAASAPPATALRRPPITCTSISPLPRTTSSSSEPRSRSRQRACVGLPITMRVTLWRRAYVEHHLTRARTDQPHDGRAERLGEPQVGVEARADRRPRAARRCCARPRPPSTAPAGRRRCGVRRASAAPTRATRRRTRGCVRRRTTSPRSRARAGRPRTSTSTRSAARRSASSRSASRLPRRKNPLRGALGLLAPR